MSDVINGFVADPSPRLEAAFQAVAQQEMCELPFFRAHIPVRACGFQLFEQQWIGGMLTPWMLSLLVLRGREKCGSHVPWATNWRCVCRAATCALPSVRWRAAGST
ncbi:Hydrogenase-2 operon protein hybE [Yokenella regensburgei]|nr:Hydrogenase-2 operon protein hybE [Yokenella regensburgei]